MVWQDTIIPQSSGKKCSRNTAKSFDTPVRGREIRAGDDLR